MTTKWMLLSLFTCAAFAETAKPDLIVRNDVLARHWVVRDESFTANLCSVQEGGITPGDHRVLRFTVTTPNVGNADLVVGDPNAHVAAGDGLFEFASCHNHYHFRHYALYELVDPATNYVWRAAKRGFCMIDVDPNPGYYGSTPGPRQYLSCGAVGIPGNQGISAGWADTYVFLLGGQYFVLDGGDGQPAVPPGQYILRITVNPGFTPQGGEACPYPDPLHPGVCHQLPEGDFENNVGQITITIPERPGKNGFGPLAGAPPASPADEIDHH